MGDCLAKIDTGQKLGAGCCAPYRGELGSHLTQCHLGRGIDPYQVPAVHSTGCQTGLDNRLYSVYKHLPGFDNRLYRVNGAY